jgi:hypothetical protein
MKLSNPYMNARQQARKDLEDENKALPAKIRQVRGGQ